MAGIRQYDGFDTDILGVVGHDDFGHQNARGRGHETGGEEIGEQLFAQHRGIGTQNRACDPGHANGHHAEQLCRCQAGEIGADDQRAFRLADKNIRRRAQALNAGDASDRLDPAANPFDDELHDAEVVKHRNQRREKDDDRQRGNRKTVAADRRPGNRPENEIGPRLGIAEQVRHTARQCCQHTFAKRRYQHKKRNAHLHRKGRADDAQANPAPVGRKCHRNGQNQHYSGKADQQFLHQHQPSPGPLSIARDA